MSHPLVARMQPHRRSVFGEMSALAASIGAVNLGQGFPDTDGPDLVRDAAISAIQSGLGAQYPPAHGIPELRAAICGHQQAWYGLEWDPATDVVVTTGAAEAIVATVLAFVEPGDEVLVLEPWFDLYAAAIDLAGGIRVSVPPVPGTFRPDPTALQARITPASRMLILNSPHNPSGSVLTAQELAAHRAGRHQRRPARALRRGLRAPLVRRAPAHPGRHPCGDGRAHHHGGICRKEPVLHRMEGRLGHGSQRSHQFRPSHPPTPELRVRRALPVGRRRRPVRAPELALGEVPGHVGRAARPPVPGTGRPRPDRPSERGDLLPAHRCDRHGVRQRSAVLC